MKSDGPVHVLVVQASPLFHTLVSGALSRYRGIRVLLAATDAGEVRDRILNHHPDVILLDLGLPEPDGTKLLRTLREHYPVPIIACSGSSKHDGRRALSAIEQGALDVVVKPAGCGPAPVRKLGAELARKIRAAVAEARPVPTPKLRQKTAGRLSFRAAGINPGQYLIVIGASTGGTEAVRALLSHMPADAPPIAVVQHIPAFFTPSFAKRLDKFSPLRVSEALEGDRLAPGWAVVARGDTHLTVRRRASAWHAHYTDQRPVNRHCPSVDVLFESAADAAGGRAIGILMTGMGADGARGLLRLRRCGALTVAQDARSCVVYGMPKVAQQLDAVELTAPPEEIPRAVLKALAKRQRRAAAPSTSAR